MIQTEKRLTIPMLLLSCLAVSCSCPDLAFDGLRFEGVAAAGHTTDFEYSARLTVTEQSADGTLGKTLFTDRDPFSNFRSIPAGRYQISGTVRGQAVAPLDGVCTIGDRTGCEAEDTPESATAMVRIQESASGEITLILDRNGTCP